MAILNPHRSPEEVSRIGLGILEQRIQPMLLPDDHGRFIAIDIKTEDFEVDDDDYTAVMRVRGRRPDGEIWIGRVGERTAYQIRRCP